MCGDARSGATTLPLLAALLDLGVLALAVVAVARPKLFGTCTHGVVRPTPKSGIRQQKFGRE